MAAKSSYKYQLGAVAIRRNKIVSTGFNYVGDSLTQRCGMHAEVNAVRRSGGCDSVLVVRINRRNQLMCSKPCDNCMKYMKKHGVKKVYYIDWDSSIKELKV